MLHAQSKLLTNYTQNIDNLEFASGVSASRIVNCHGSWDTATCLSCGKNVAARKYIPIVWADGFPRCSCGAKELNKSKPLRPKPKKRKRAIYEGDSDHSSDDGTTTPKGLFKPDITFFGEEIPDKYVAHLNSDRGKADLLLVIGTSLKTRPVKTMLFEFPPTVPQIWINKERFSGWRCDLPGVQFDIELLGDCDTIIEEICSRANLPLNAFFWKPGKVPSKTSTQSTAKVDENVQQGLKVPDTQQDHVFNNLVVRDRRGSIVTEASSIYGESVISISNTQDESDDERTSVISHPDSVAVRVQSDMDAEWRWRFSKNLPSPTRSRQ